MYWIIICVKKYEYPGDLFYLCKYVATRIKCKGKEGIKKLCFADWTLDNCVRFRELIIISAKNKENAIFIINIQPSKVYAKSGESFFLLKYSSTKMTPNKLLRSLKFLCKLPVLCWNTVTDLESCSNTQSTTLKMCECSSTWTTFLQEVVKINHFVLHTVWYMRSG